MMHFPYTNAANLNTLLLKSKFSINNEYAYTRSPPTHTSTIHTAVSQYLNISFIDAYSFLADSSANMST
jgi:hypothetical protein